MLWRIGSALYLVALRIQIANDSIRPQVKSELLHRCELEKHTRQKELTLDLEKLVADLKKERDRLGHAITALLGSALSGGAKKKKVGRPKGSKSKKPKRGGLTPEGRKRLSIAMKKRWAERKKKA